MKLTLLILAATLAGCATRSYAPDPQTRAETAEAWEAIDKMIEQRRAAKERKAFRHCTWTKMGVDWWQTCW